jgi:hypothetical protein
MRQHVERLWRLAVAVEAAERSGQSDHARELRSQFNGTGDRDVQSLRGHAQVNCGSRQHEPQRSPGNCDRTS